MLAGMGQPEYVVRGEAQAVGVVETGPTWIRVPDVDRLLAAGAGPAG